MSIWEDIETEKFWRMANLGNEYSWECKGNSRKKLGHILDGHGIILDDIFCSSDTKKAANIRLHSVISSILGELDDDAQKQLCFWFIKDWGGIRRGNPKTIMSWLERLSNFEEKNVLEFIKTQGYSRISSWSKILSFIAPEKYAIYDSRTAFASNFILNKMGNERRFYMPTGRNKRIVPLLGKLKKDDNNYIGYLEYLDLLKTYPSKENGLIEAEMLLFSNAPYLAEKK